MTPIEQNQFINSQIVFFATDAQVSLLCQMMTSQISDNGEIPQFLYSVSDVDVADILSVAEVVKVEWLYKDNVYNGPIVSILKLS